jgi:NADH:ubiquinone reductase (non-electrogenic)
LASKIRITLVEALPSVLPMFSKELINYTQSTFKQSKIDILTKTMVKEIKDNSVVLQMPDKSIVDMPCGLVVWAAVWDLLYLLREHEKVTFEFLKGNTGRQLTKDLISKLPNAQTNKRGITVDGKTPTSLGFLFSLFS